MQKKTRKVVIWILVVIIAIGVYMSIGRMYAHSLLKADYYPKSWQAKVFKPIAPVWKGIQSPFDNNLTEDSQKIINDYKSFEDYYQENYSIGLVLLWPIALVLIYAVCIVSWAWFLLIKLYILVCLLVSAIWWWFSGGLGKTIIGL